MYKLKLIRVKSYTGKVSATQVQPLVEVETKAEADELVATGYFALEAKPTKDTDEKKLADMKVAELKAYAAEKGIDVSGCGNKAEYVARIEAAEAETSDEETSDEGDYDEE